jgi:hypothetical protein
MRNPKFNDLLAEVQAMHDSKNTDYATKDDPLANLLGCVRIGLPPLAGVTIRMQDKWERIENFFRNGKLLNEPVRDAYLDNAIYSLMAVLIIDREKLNGAAMQELNDRAKKLDLRYERLKRQAVPTPDVGGCDPGTACNDPTEYGKASGPRPAKTEDMLGARFADSQVHTGHDKVVNSGAEGTQVE